MIEEDIPVFKKARFWLRLVAISGLVVFIILFRTEFSIVIQFFYDVLMNLPGLQLPQLPQGKDLQAFMIVFYGIFGNFVLFNCFLFLFSQFILPVQGLNQRTKAFLHLWLYLLGLHGAAIFVKEGKVVSSADETKKTLPGVALVDLNSAIAIEKLWVQSGWEDMENDEDVAFSVAVNKQIRQKSFTESNATVRVAGPGVSFMSGDERLAGSVDLRKQVRAQPNIEATTRDGIDVKSNVFVVFTLGEPPQKLTIVETENDKFQVAFLEDKVIHENGRVIQQRLIKNFSDELEPEQTAEVRNFKHNAFRDSKLIERIVHPKSDPYIFDPERVFKAFYSSPNNAKEETKIEWTEIPVRVAVEEFRNLIGQYIFDELYKPTSDDEFPLLQVKKKLTTKMRNLGVLNFEFAAKVSHRGYLAVGDDILDKSVVIYPEQAFHKNSVLRQRGIKVIAVGFSELAPPEEVVTQRLRFWQARWEKQEMFDKADAELKAMRIRNQARAQTQQDMIYTLSKIFKSVPHSEEALAMRIYQALEAAATAPIEKNLLPHDTINMLRNLRQWLIPISDEESRDLDASSNRGVLDE